MWLVEFHLKVTGRSKMGCQSITRVLDPICERHAASRQFFDSNLYFISIELDLVHPRALPNDFGSKVSSTSSAESLKKDKVKLH
jgi:hypothetical protein